MAALAPSRLLREAFDNMTADEVAAERLKAAYLSFKDRAAVLAEQIAGDFPELTVHDESHLDALWELADQIVAPEFSLNPVEAFVLGGAILLHDLGLAIAAYPDGKQSLQTEPAWRDALASALEPDLGRRPRQSDIASASDQIKRQAEKQVLRERHASQAENLAQLSWKSDDGDLFLIEDSELRSFLGPLIGQLAHSHWWDTASLPDVFHHPVGPPAWCPAAWTIRPLIIACVLRVCDALHLDARRAPIFLRALREPLPSDSKAHWIFQERLARPYLKGGRLAFTSAKPFNRSDADAWWRCYDTLSYADQIIREVQAVLADFNFPALEVQGVSGVDDPARFAIFVPTDDWIPVDTHVQVSNVADLVLKLGGEELYGRNRPEVALRELIQNAADAIRVRRVVDSRDDSWGHITVSLRREGDTWVLAVTDTGVGMDEERLTGSLLDFGQSFWSSGAVAREFPGLLSSEFKSAGRFGIGFFSVFMLGTHVEVLSRPYDSGHSDTKRLTFTDGVVKRPILSAAPNARCLRDGGTTVQIRISEHTASILLGEESDGEWTFPMLCRWLCPCLDVNLSVELDQHTEDIVAANDWLQIDGDQLFRRTVLAAAPSRPVPDLIEHAANHLEIVRDDDGNAVGRIAILPIGHRIGHGYRYAREGVVTAGGLRASTLNGIAGVLHGEPVTAARDAALPLLSESALSSWATTQAEHLLPREDFPPDVLSACAMVVLACGGDISSLPLCQVGGIWKTQSELREWIGEQAEILVMDRDDVDYDIKHFGRMDLLPNLITTESSYGSLVSAELRVGRVANNWPKGLADRYELEVVNHHLALLISEAWGVKAGELLVDLENAESDRSVTIGERAGEPVAYAEVDVFRKPRTSGP
jgi:hypothetical protein